MLSSSSDPKDTVEIIAFYSSGGFSFLADLKEFHPIRTSDILCVLPSDISYSEGTLLELPEEHYSKFLGLKEKNQQRLEEIFAEAMREGYLTGK